MSARFGELLLNRRRELGLSIQQVANTIKIRPQIIEYFELGNFASMPPRGYAQGMISSYARYLGLNPTEIVNIYFDDLCAYESGGERRGGNLQGAAGPVSPRSSNESGRFYMVGSRPQSTRYGQRALQAGYVTENGSGSEIRAQRDRVRRTLPPAEASVPMASGTARNPRAGYGDGSRNHGEYGRMRNTRLASGSRSAQGSRRSHPRERSRMQRNGSASERLDGYRRTPSRTSGRNRPTGREAYRERGARRISASRERGGRRDSRPMRGASSASILAGFDPKFLIGAAVVILAILVLLFVLVSRACSSGSTTTTLAQETAKAETTAKKSSSKSSTSKKKKTASSTDDQDGDSSDESDDASTDSESSDTDDAATDSATGASDGSSDSASSSITVKVKIASKKTAFLEVRVDGKLVFGRQATGPLTKEFTASESIDITTSKPSCVTVTKNGKKVPYDSAAAGVARVSLAVPKKSSSSTSDDSTSSDSSTDSESSSGASSTQSSSTASSSSSSSASSQ